MMASLLTLPVMGVPIRSCNAIDGWDSMLSVLQMPTGVPVGRLALNRVGDARFPIVQMLSMGNPEIRQRIRNYKESLRIGLMNKVARLKHA